MAVGIGAIMATRLARLADVVMTTRLAGVIIGTRLEDTCWWRCPVFCISATSRSQQNGFVIVVS